MTLQEKAIDFHPGKSWKQGHCTCYLRPDGSRGFQCRWDGCTVEGKACNGYCLDHFAIVMTRPLPLTFNQLREKNLSRVHHWHYGFNDQAPNQWSGGDWSNAMCGEAGETANVVKKLRRLETGVIGNGDVSKEELLEMLAMEIADTATYLDLLAAYYGIDMGEAIRKKFNIVSDKQGFPEKL